MSSPYSNLASKLEQAGSTFAATFVPIGTGVFTGQSTDTKTPPLVICEADENTAEEEPQFTGNYWMDFSVSVVTMAPTDADGVSPKPANDSLVATVFDKFNASNIAAVLSAQGIADFTCIAMIPRGPQFETDGSAWKNTFHFRAYCCPSTL